MFLEISKQSLVCSWRSKWSLVWILAIYFLQAFTGRCSGYTSMHHFVEYGGVRKYSFRLLASSLEMKNLPLFINTLFQPVWSLMIIKLISKYRFWKTKVCKTLIHYVIHVCINCILYFKVTTIKEFCFYNWIGSFLTIEIVTFSSSHS